MPTKRSRRTRRAYYRAISSKKPSNSTVKKITEDGSSKMEDANPIDESGETRPEISATPLTDEVTDKPTIILSPEEIASLKDEPALPQVHIPISFHRENDNWESGYNYVAPDTDNEDDEEDYEDYDDYEEDDYDDSFENSSHEIHTQDESPTIILEVSELMAMPAPIINNTSPALPKPFIEPWAQTQRRKPENPISPPPPPALPHRMPSSDNHAEQFARLHRQRLEREMGAIERTSEEPYITDKLRQWWTDIQPGINRILGRTQRTRIHGSRTSGQLPAVHIHGFDAISPEPMRRLSDAARQIGNQAQTAATPAIKKFHERAERAAQKFVDKIDERLGGSPPLQHVLVGPGRMIVSFAPNISIRDAQIIIASVQARALRRLVGYNAYLVIVPPGREAHYAERFHGYREVTGVHFGPQRPSTSFVGRMAGR
jgi:hypothetical protein